MGCVTVAAVAPLEDAPSLSWKHWKCQIVIKHLWSQSTTTHHEVSQAIALRRFYSEQARNEDVIVDYDYVKNATKNKNILVIDVREPNEVKEHGKIPNSVNIPLGNVSTALGTMSEKEFEKLYNIPKPTEETEIIFYCMIGKRSGMAQQNTINLGYKNVKNYLGSWLEWESKTR
ncbi:putative thiosulfate sulfurtransferase, mitochondrial [Melitaea cinxia]|uniref:putative thiosulfate sulfurtransferase, mitochondrial n=1 Tax=Melitaea cinxia TaxID=113334 RepID=UPI001E271C5F|nr:putative thiosulfate sulfurtransferase, mitochondrial [Melitaea cinxia]